MRKIAALLNKSLAPAGLELKPRRRTLAELQSLPQTPSANRIIELIGTQGVGKSTLGNDAQKHLKERLFFRSDLGGVGPSPSVAIELEDFHRTVFFERIAQLQADKADAWRSVTRSRQAARVIGESMTLLTHKYPRGFFLDEGLFKNFPREVLKHAAASPDFLWKGRGLILLRAGNAASVLSRYTNRVSERGERGLMQRPPSKAEILTQIEEDNIVFEQLLNVAQSRGAATLQIFAEDPHEKNVARILEFERTQFAILK